MPYLEVLNLLWRYWWPPLLALHCIRILFNLQHLSVWEITQRFWHALYPLSNFKDFTQSMTSKILFLKLILMYLCFIFHVPFYKVCQIMWKKSIWRDKKNALSWYITREKNRIWINVHIARKANTYRVWNYELRLSICGFQAGNNSADLFIDDHGNGGLFLVGEDTVCHQRLLFSTTWLILKFKPDNEALLEIGVGEPIQVDHSRSIESGPF